jgi:hypothetical protein
MTTTPPPPRSPSAPPPALPLAPLTNEQTIDSEHNAEFDAVHVGAEGSPIRERALATLQLVREWRAMREQVEALHELRVAYDGLGVVEETSDIAKNVDAFTRAVTAAVDAVTAAVDTVRPSETEGGRG